MRELYKNITPLIEMIDKTLKKSDISDIEKKVLSDVAEILMVRLPREDVHRIIKAKWIKSEITGLYFCGNCKSVGDRKWNYCNKCGAKMK